MRSYLKVINAIIALSNRSCTCLCRLNTRIYYYLMNVSKFLCIVKLRNNKVIAFYIFLSYQPSQICSRGWYFLILIHTCYPTPLLIPFCWRKTFVTRFHENDTGKSIDKRTDHTNCRVILKSRCCTVKIKDRTETSDLISLNSEKTGCMHRGLCLRYVYAHNVV